jgi:2-phospho-L-lactate/phosphoenolpyruvate guanylyltransferase
VRTLAILPVKSFGSAKQRLAGSLGAGSRQALAQAMFSDVLSALGRAPGLDEIAVVTSDRAAAAAARGRRVRVLPDPAQAGQSEAALIGIRCALADGFDRVLLVPGDTPLVQPDDLAGLIDDSHGVVIVPDRHGTGTNALALAPPDAIEPSFGEGSFVRHMAAAKRSDVPHRVSEIGALALDVDTLDDLAELAAELEARRGHAALTRGALRQLNRVGGSPLRVPQASA